MSRAADSGPQVAVVGGGVVGAAVAYSLARRGVRSLLLEAEPELALAASGTNSGILHTGFDSAPGELETRLILRSAALRDEILDELGVPVLRCGAVMAPRSAEEERAVAGLAQRAGENGVAVALGATGELEVPGEAVTDPVAYTLALAAAAARAGAEVRTGARVEAIARTDDGLVLGLGDGDGVTARVVVNCAGLHADDVARLAGDGTFEVYPRKGEFFVFDPPEGTEPDRIRLRVPTARTKGVLAFPTVDGRVVAGPTAHDQADKSDWSVRDDAWEEVMSRAEAMGAADWGPPVARYAGLRPAGRGANYLIGASSRCPGLVNVAAIRSTGLSASLGIGEHVASLVEAEGIVMGPDRPLAPGEPPTRGFAGAWWERSARHWAAAT